VATPVLTLVHEPVPVASFNVIEVPWQRLKEPVVDVIAAGTALTVMLFVAEHPAVVV
jgi:hypothetical protein